MKSILISILVLALAGGAFLSKPSEKNFRYFMKTKYGVTDKGKDLKDVAVEKIGEKLGLKTTTEKVQTFLEGCTYKDRLLWADIEKDGKTIYTGVFSKWFEREKAEP